MVSGGGGSSKSKSSTMPWYAQASYLKDLYASAEGIYNQGPNQFFPGSTVAGFAPGQQQALQMAQQRGMEGSSLTRAAQGEAEKTLGGEYLDPSTNPWLTQNYDLAARDMGRNYYDQVNALGSRLEAAGRTGSGAHATGMNVAQENYGRGLGQLGANLYGQNYQQERGRMMGAMGQANALANQDYRDLNASFGAGAQMQQQSQAVLDSAVQRWDFDQNASAQKLAEFSSLIGQPVMASQSKSKAWNMNVGIGTCWVAAEYFGWLTPAWQAARRWLMVDWQGPAADRFREIYREIGIPLAEQISHDDELRERLRPFFEWARVQGEAL